MSLDCSSSLSERAVTKSDAQAGLELSHPERLGHVVVGPAVERGDLAILGAVHGQHDDGDVAPLADPSTYLHTVEIGQAEVEDDDVGRSDGCLGDALLTRGRHQHAVAERAEADPQHPEQCLVVVDGEDPGHLGHDHGDSCRGQGEAEAGAPIG